MKELSKSLKSKEININTITGKNIKFRPVEEKDASFILELRSSKGGHLTKTDITVEQQQNWIKNYKKKECEREEFYFVIENLDNEKLGVLRVYDFLINTRKEASFCWGSWIIKDSAPLSTAIESVLLVYDFAFNELGFDNCHFDVRKDNQKVIRFHESFGATRIFTTKLDYIYDLPKKDYLLARNRFTKFIKK